MSTMPSAWPLRGALAHEVPSRWCSRGTATPPWGARAGLRRRGSAEAALVWLDAHGDFNTPATETGYLDGMPLAMLLRPRLPRNASSARSRREPLAASARSCTPARRETWTAAELGSLAVFRRRLVDGAELRERRTRPRSLAPALDALAAERRDCRRPEAGTRRRRRTCTSTWTCSTPRPRPASRSRRRTGCPRPQLLEAIDLVRERFTLVAVTVTSFTPDRDGGRDHPGRRPRRTAARHDGKPGPPAVVRPARTQRRPAARLRRRPAVRHRISDSGRQW